MTKYDDEVVVPPSHVRCADIDPVVGHDILRVVDPAPPRELGGRPCGRIPARKLEQPDLERPRADRWRGPLRPVVWEVADGGFLANNSDSPQIL